jgi:hypothetical protein
MLCSAQHGGNGSHQHLASLEQDKQSIKSVGSKTLGSVLWQTFESNSSSLPQSLVVINPLTKTLDHLSWFRAKGLRLLEIHGHGSIITPATEECKTRLAGSRAHDHSGQYISLPQDLRALKPQSPPQPGTRWYMGTEAKKDLGKKNRRVPFDSEDN